MKEGIEGDVLKTYLRKRKLLELEAVNTIKVYDRKGVLKLTFQKVTDKQKEQTPKVVNQ